MSDAAQGLAGWLSATPVGESQFFGLSREVTPLELAMRLRSLGDRPSWWRPLRRLRWDRDFFSIVNWWLMGCSQVYR